MSKENNTMKISRYRSYKSFFTILHSKSMTFQELTAYIKALGKTEFMMQIPLGGVADGR